MYFLACQYQMCEFCVIFSTDTSVTVDEVQLTSGDWVVLSKEVRLDLCALLFNDTAFIDCYSPTCN